jgi:hypothetical protein
MHITKKKRKTITKSCQKITKKEKSRYSDLFLVAAVLTPPIQHVLLLQRRRLQEGNDAQAPPSLNQRT